MVDELPDADPGDVGRSAFDDAPNHHLKGEVGAYPDFGGQRNSYLDAVPTISLVRVHWLPDVHVQPGGRRRFPESAHEGLELAVLPERPAIEPGDQIADIKSRPLRGTAGGDAHDERTGHRPEPEQIFEAPRRFGILPGAPRRGFQDRNGEPCAQRERQRTDISLHESPREAS